MLDKSRLTSSRAVLLYLALIFRPIVLVGEASIAKVYPVSGKVQMSGSSTKEKGTRGPYVGRSITRAEDLRFVTGQGGYTDDHRVENETYCVFVRCPHAHARIIDIDVSIARYMPGVIAIVTGKDYRTDGLLPVDHAPNPADAVDVRKRAFTPQGDRVIREEKHWPLIIDVARYIGEPIAAVIAESSHWAVQAAEAVQVKYEELPAAISIAEAIAPDAPPIWPDIPGNYCFTYDAGDAAGVELALERAGACCSAHVRNQSYCQLPA